jgi:GNAT superfamily N-acetyltransferase
MSQELSTLLREEESIFRNFNSYRRLSAECVAYASPDSQQIPHWNMVYPPDGNHRYTPGELRLAQDFYSESKLTGHVLVTGDEWADRCAEISEYFVADETPGAVAQAPEITEFSTAAGTDLDDFCGIIQAAFALSEGTTSYFRKKMGTLSAAVSSRFWIIEYQGRRCGTASIFKTNLGSDFLFNFGVLPEFQNKHLGKAMLEYVLSRTESKVYTYSHNPVMRETLLPAAGFRSVQKAYVVSLDNYARWGARENAQ